MAMMFLFKTEITFFFSQNILDLTLGTFRILKHHLLRNLLKCLLGDNEINFYIHRMTLFLVSIVLCLAVVTGQTATIETLTNLKGTIEDLLTTDDQNIAGFVRLAFHDCIGVGGCDGCINHDDSHNAGLRKYSDQLDSVYEENSELISRADLYAYASIVALGKASDNVFDMDSFRVGRKDCSADGRENDASENFPGANMQNLEVVTDFFKTAFGLSTRETIALLGAHTLGRARTENSGFEGPWIPGTTGPNVLDNQFYREIVGPRWFHKTLETPNRFQWQKNQGSGGAGNTANSRNNPRQRNILLNSDGALAFDLDLDEHGDMNNQCEMCGRNTDPVEANIPCCPRGDGFAICAEYARSNDVWLQEFTLVFYKMIDRNDNELTSPVETTAESLKSTSKVPEETTKTTTEAPKTTKKVTKPPRKTRPSRPRKGKPRTGRRNDSSNNKIKNKIDRILSELQDIRKKVHQ